MTQQSAVRAGRTTCACGCVYRDGVRVYACHTGEHVSEEREQLLAELRYWRTQYENAERRLHEMTHDVDAARVEAEEMRVLLREAVHDLCGECTCDIWEPIQNTEITRIYTCLGCRCRAFFVRSPTVDALRVREAAAKLALLETETAYVKAMTDHNANGGKKPSKKACRGVFRAYLITRTEREKAEKEGQGK